MLELLISGGWVMVPLMVLAVAATAIALERFWTLRVSEVIPRGIVQEIEHWSRGKTLEGSEIQRLRQDSPLGELLAAALLVRHKPREVIKERIEDVGRHISHDLNRFLPTLGTIAAVAPHRVFPGNRPSTTILFRRLDAFTLGRLVALYEHKVAVQGCLWGINSFDQWGVELGKVLASGVLRELEGGAAGAHDGSTAALLARFAELRG